MSKVFISYRRTDSKHATGRLYDYLASKLGASNVFIDIDSIAPGERFDEKIKRTIKRCDTVLVMIGLDWNPREDGEYGFRLNNPEDWVRKEISAALASSKKIIPILIDETEMPKAGSLPDDLVALTARHAIRLRSGVDFSGDARKISKAIGRSWFRPILLASSLLLLLIAVAFGVYKLNPVIDRPVAIAQVIMDGMSYPDQDVEKKHPNLIVNSRIIGEKYGLINDRPWRRKPLAVSDDNKREFFQPRAVYTHSDLHVLYLAKAWHEPTIFVYELKPKSGELYIVDQLPYSYGTGYYFDDEANLAIRGEYLYYFWDSGHSGRRYKIGSQEPPKDADFYIARKSQFYTSISPNGRFIVAPNAGYVSDTAPEAYRLATRGQQQGSLSEGEFTGISLYDKKLDSNSILFKQKYTGDWSIGSIIWSDDSEAIFFDNAGAVACVWKYTISHRVLQKIVPEHQTRSPFFLRLEGRDFILYVETTKDGLEVLTSRLMIATE